MADAVTGAGASGDAVAYWVGRLSDRPIPVLRQTIERLARLRENGDAVPAREIARVVLHDPMMALNVFRFLQSRRDQRQTSDITTIEHAIIMLGVSPFFDAFADLQPVDKLLAREPAALEGLMTVISRARHALLHARDWARLRHDVESDEIIIAALLHDMAEMLLWCFAPQRAAELQRGLAQGNGPCDTDVEQSVLGFKLNELQLVLAETWGLPRLLASLMDDGLAERPRSRNVIIAVSLARHAAGGWENVALRDDFTAIKNLLGRPLPEIRQRTFHTALEAVRDRDWYGGLAPAAWLPPFPLDLEADEENTDPAISSAILKRVQHVLASAEEAELINWSASGLPQREGPALAHPALVALAGHGLYRGAGLARIAYLTAQPGREAVRARYLAGVADTGRLAHLVLPLLALPGRLDMITRGGVVHWRGESDEIPFAALPAQWRATGASAGFFAAAFSRAGEISAVLYADGGGGTLDREKFSDFVETCGLLARRLGADATIPCA